MHPILPLRSLLFVPGDNERKLARALESPADALVCDWEDGVAPDTKALARSQTSAVLNSRPANQRVVLIRINPVSSPEFEKDVVYARQAHPEGLVLSKITSARDIRQVNKICQMRGQPELWLFPMIESAIGLSNAAEIARCQSVAALLFGAEDFCANTGIIRGKEELELLYARSALVIAASAAGRKVIDSPCLSLNDAQAVRESAVRARDLGFTGKLAIHPRQVDILNQAFVPRSEEIEKASRIIEAFAGGGQGVISVDGMMVDDAVVKRARRLLQLVRRAPGE